jgi:YD repeat-containing protein
MREYLRDYAGRLVGWREDGPSQRINGRDSAGRLVGWFDSNRNETRDANGRLIGQGDLLSRMF